MTTSETAKKAEISQGTSCGSDKRTEYRRLFVTSFLECFFDVADIPTIGLTTSDVHRALLGMQDVISGLCNGFRKIAIANSVRRTTTEPIQAFVASRKGGTELIGTKIPYLVVRDRANAAEHLQEFRNRMSVLFWGLGLHDVSSLITCTGIQWPPAVVIRIKHRKLQPEPRTPAETPAETPTKTPVTTLVPKLRKRADLATIKPDSPVKKLNFDAQMHEPAQKRSRLEEADLKEVAAMVTASLSTTVTDLLKQSPKAVEMNDKVPALKQATFLKLYQRKLLFACAVCASPEWYFNPNMKRNEYETCYLCHQFMHLQCVREKRIDGKNRKVCAACSLAGRSNRCHACIKDGDKSTKDTGVCRACLNWFCEEKHFSYAEFHLDGQDYRVRFCDQCMTVYQKVADMKPIE
ncbi:hypothetical protein J8273_0908 [Carpediemonas membranifera]|uniref:Uncharacterized protein n=1 Tax=Carpediemonas membranifera TaxID=201153 RepID=A0A8J6B1R9_9EUKA|nr:hypothetical protein J8273_0908 [Carpediemonas membranifera]|eukprot:KAG9397415.1 hypothetical protein J8273_0908 [Carpediemonas membranifera]